MVQSPFKLFEPYGSNDKNIFFGRDAEIYALYNLLEQTRLVLMYGASGTGKTSLIHAGLPKIFMQSDWFQISVKRRDNINASFRDELSKFSTLTDRNDLSKSINAVFETSWIPIYLVFDQFEELFTLGNHEERVQFFTDLQTLLDTPLPCKIILSMREEYIGHLYEYEPFLPTLFDKRFRVEPMKDATVKAVINQMCIAGGVTLADGQKTADQIFDQVKEGKQAAHLPYLQVYLHYLYENAIENLSTISDVRSPTSAPTPNIVHRTSNTVHPVFTEGGITTVGKLGNVLKRFIETQLEAARLHFASLGLPDDFAARLLDEFATDEGTKQARKTTDLAKHLDTEGGKVKAALHYFSEAKLLRPDEDDVERYEPVHDVVAKQIHELRSVEDKEFKVFVRQLQLAFEAWERDGKPTQRLLNELDLSKVTVYEARLKKLPNFEGQLADLIDKSRERVAFLQRQERRRRNVLWGITVAALVFAIVAFWGLFKTRTLLNHFNFSQDRAWAYNDTLKKFALIDRLGNRLTDYKFTNPQKFSENGFAIAYNNSSGEESINNKIYVVAKSGKIKDTLYFLEPTNNGLYFIRNKKGFTFYDKNYEPYNNWSFYDEIYGAKESVIEVRVSEKNRGDTLVLNTKAGFVDINGNVLVKPELEGISNMEGYEFTEGFTIIRKESKFGMINHNGNIVIPIKYSNLKRLEGNLFYAMKDSLSGIIDKNENILIPFNYKEGFFNKNFNILKDQSGSWRFFDKKLNCINSERLTGALISKMKDDDILIPLFNHEYAAYIDTNARIVYRYSNSFSLPFWNNEFAMMIIFKEKITKLQVNNLKIDKSDWAKHLKDIILVSKKGDKTITIFNNLVDKDSLAFSQFNKYILLRKKHYWSVFSNNEAKILFTLKCESINEFSNDTFKFKNNNKWGLVDKKGTIILSPQFDTIYNLVNGFALAKRGRYWSYISDKGKIAFSDFDKAINFYDDFAFAFYRGISSQGEWHCLINNGNNKYLTEKVWLTDVEDFRILPRHHFAFKVKSKWGIGKMVGATKNYPYIIVPPKFREVYTVDDESMGLARVSVGYTFYCIDDKGVMIMDLKKFQEQVKNEK